MAFLATAPLRVDFLVGASGDAFFDTPGRLALSSCPGRPQGDMQLPVDLWRLRQLRIRVVLSLVDDDEMAVYGVTGLSAALSQAGLGHLRFPLIDGCPPDDLPATRELNRRVLGLLGEGLNVLIHCIGGWGRSGTIAATLLTHEGHPPDAAIELVRQARSPLCVESQAQEAFVHRYAEEQRRHERRYLVIRRADLPLLQALLQAPLRDPAGGAAWVPVPMGQLAAAAAPLRRRESDAALVVLSGEVPLEGALPERLFFDRAHAIEADRLVPIPLSAASG